MAERPLVDRLDATVDLILARGDASAALRDPELAPLARVAAELRHYPAPAFKARLRAYLERRTSMTATMPATTIREGFTTVTPYIRVPEAGLADFLAQVFDAQQTFSSGRENGMHREVRVGNSMLMIGEGANAGAGGLMPIRPAAFHVFVPDVDAAFQRALAAGGTSLGEPADQPYGERSGFVADRFGNHWYIATALGPQSVGHALGTVTAFLRAADASAYDDFLQRGLGAVEEMRHEEGGRFRYARLRIGDAAVELGEGEPMPGSFTVHVGDPDAYFEQALAAGAKTVMPIGDQPFGRMGGVEDPAGNQWYFLLPRQVTR